MQPKHLLLVPALSSILVAATLTGGDVLAFKVAAKTKLVKTFETKVELSSREMSMTIDGQDPHGGMGAPSVEMRDEEKLVFADEHVAVEDGRTTKLVRRFEELGGEQSRKVSMPSGGDPQEQSEEKESPLEGKSVEFAWKDDAYAASWPEGTKGDDALLEGLVADADLAGFLPSKAVSEGDSWKLEPKLFNRLTSPGGDLRLHAKKANGEADEERDPIAKLLEEKLDGDATAKYGGTREEKDAKLAVIEVNAKLAASGKTEIDGVDNEVEYKVEYTGEVLWDVAAGRLASLRLEGKVELVLQSVKDVEFGGEKHELRRKSAFEGEITHHASVE